MMTSAAIDTITGARRGSHSDSPVVTTREAMATSKKQADAIAARWNAIIDKTLIEWGRDPGLLEESDLIPPTHTAINRAFDVCLQLREGGADAPNRIVPDGDGGIIIERWSGGVTEAFEIAGNGTAEYTSFQNGKVTHRVLVG